MINVNTYIDRMSSRSQVKFVNRITNVPKARLPCPCTELFSEYRIFAFTTFYLRFKIFYNILSAEPSSSRYPSFHRWNMHGSGPHISASLHLTKDRRQFFLFGVCVCVRAKCLGENLGNRHTSTQSTIHITHHVHEGEKGSNKRLMIKYFFSLCCTGYGFSLWVCGLLHCVCISFYVNLARFCINMYAGLE